MTGRRAWLALLVVPLAAAGCGGKTASPGVAKLGATTTAAKAAPNAAASGAQPASASTPFERFSACMRSHGVPQFPDPTNHGTTLRVGPIDGVDESSPRYQAAQARCSALLSRPGGELGPTITPAQQLDYLRAAACMRSHGIPGFPDPTITDGHVTFHVPASVAASSTRFLEAEATCRKLIPPGLPYSN